MACTVCAPPRKFTPPSKLPLRWGRGHAGPCPRSRHFTQARLPPCPHLPAAASTYSFATLANDSTVTTVRGVYTSWECVDGQPGYYRALVEVTYIYADGEGESPGAASHYSSAHAPAHKLRSGRRGRLLRPLCGCLPNPLPGRLPTRLSLAETKPELRCEYGMVDIANWEVRLLLFRPPRLCPAIGKGRGSSAVMRVPRPACRTLTRSPPRSAPPRPTWWPSSTGEA